MFRNELHVQLLDTWGLQIVINFLVPSGLQKQLVRVLTRTRDFLKHGAWLLSNLC